MIRKVGGAEGTFLFAEECQLINIEGMRRFGEGGNHCFAVSTNILKIRQKSSMNSKIFLGNGVFINCLLITKGGKLSLQWRDCYIPP